MPRTRTRRRRPAPLSAGLRKLGQRLRDARLDAGLSQAQLGAPYFTRAHVSAIELGKIRPAMRSLEHMARKVGRPASYFLDDGEAEGARGERELEIAAIAGLLTLQHAPEALRRAEKLLDGPGLSVRDTCRLRLHAGAALNLMHRGGDALRGLSVAQRLAAELRDESLGRSADYHAAVATRIAGNPRAARDILEPLLRRCDQAPRDQLLRLRVLITLGGCAQDLGEPDAAAAHYRQALEWSNEIGDLARIAFIHQGLGNALRSMGDRDAAAGEYQRALTSAELLNDAVAVLVIRNALAVMAAEAGHIATAQEHIAHAVALARAAGPSAYLAQCLATRAEIAIKSEDHALARTSAGEALAAAKDPGAEAARARATAMLVLAELDLREGRAAAAEKRMSDAAEIYRGIGAKAELGDVLMRLSRAATGRGDPQAAERYAARAYAETRPRSANVEV